MTLNFKIRVFKLPITQKNVKICVIKNNCFSNKFKSLKNIPNVEFLLKMLFLDQWHFQTVNRNIFNSKRPKKCAEQKISVTKRKLFYN